MRSTARARRNESGMTLVELMIAMIVLATGMCAIAILITTAIASNGRNKGDSSATMVAQSVMSRLSMYPANKDAGVSGPPLTITDCRPAPLGGAQNLNIPTAGGPAPVGNGAALVPLGQLNAGSINWLNGPPPGYSIIYFACAYSDANSSTAQPFEVRWNVINLNTIAGVTYSKLITVSARPQTPIGGGNQLKFYTPPVTLRTIVNMN